MYFDMIPKIYYDSKANNKYDLLTNLMTRVKLRTDIKDDIFDYDYYDVIDGETPEIIAHKYDELISDYKDAIDDFSKVINFKQKWNGLALSRKERQDGTKTILISSPRAFEKADIWCVTFSDKYFAFAGSTVRSNMATYMNLDFEKASREFKGVFSKNAYIKGSKISKFHEV